MAIQQYPPPQHQGQTPTVFEMLAINKCNARLFTFASVDLRAGDQAGSGLLTNGYGFVRRIIFRRSNR